MTATTTLPRIRTAPSSSAPPRSPRRTVEIRAATARFGQMDLDDPRWPQVEDELDRVLESALLLSADPRAQMWRGISEDPATPRVVKLRTLARVVAGLTSR